MEHIIEEVLEMGDPVRSEVISQLLVFMGPTEITNTMVVLEALDRGVI